MAALFLAQATNTDLTLMQQLGIIGVLLLTSKGAAGVTGSGFIVLAATLASVVKIPVASIALILGVDRFMSDVRGLDQPDRQWGRDRRGREVGRCTRQAFMRLHPTGRRSMRRTSRRRYCRQRNRSGLNRQQTS